MTEPTKPPAGKPESYAFCPGCTKEKGEPVYYHKSQLRGDDEWFLEDRAPNTMVCPEGHVVQLPAPKNPAPAPAPEPAGAGE